MSEYNNFAPASVDMGKLRYRVGFVISNSFMGENTDYIYANTLAIARQIAMRFSNEAGAFIEEAKGDVWVKI